MYIYSRVHICSNVTMLLRDAKSVCNASDAL